MSRLQAFALLVLAACGPAGSGQVDPSDPDPTGPDDTTHDVTVPTVPPDPDGAPTWYQDIAPLVADRCGSCHRVGGQGPFSVETYEEAVPWGPAMAAAIADGTMPPFYAVSDAGCTPRLGWLEDISLSDAEKQLVYDWVAADMPEGDPTTAAPAELRRPVSQHTTYLIDESSVLSFKRMK
jgi:hypothetical protein